MWIVLMSFLNTRENESDTMIYTETKGSPIDMGCMLKSRGGELDLRLVETSPAKPPFFRLILI
jgi:hypothetical protein